MTGLQLYPQGQHSYTYHSDEDKLKHRSNSTPPEYYSIPNAPGFRIHFTQHGKDLDFSDCLIVLLFAESSFISPSGVDAINRTIPKTSNTYSWNTVQLALAVGQSTLPKDAALFMAGVMTWGSQYGFSAVGNMQFISPQGHAIVSGSLGHTKPGTPSSATRPLNTTESYLWPIPNVPDFFIRFTLNGITLPRGDSLRALEAANIDLIHAYHQAPMGVDPPLPGPRTWTEGAVSFTITPTKDMTVVTAGIFVISLMMWVSRDSAEAEMAFIREVGGYEGEMLTLGTGKLVTAETATA